MMHDALGVKYALDRAIKEARDKRRSAMYDGNRFADGAPGEHGHYSRFTPQPIDIIAAWNLNHWQAEALTYLVRYDMKGGKEDLEKAIWYINDLIKRKYGDS